MSARLLVYVGGDYACCPAGPQALVLEAAGEATELVQENGPELRYWPGLDAPNERGLWVFCGPIEALRGDWDDDDGWRRPTRSELKALATDETFFEED